MESLKICFAHHLSLGYYGGGEKWLISTAKELIKRGHDVEICALPFLLDGKPKINPKNVLEDIPYTESLHHNIKADVVYMTYNPLSWLNFKTSRPRIAGIHAHSYWQKPHLRYGLLPNIANIANKFTSYFELRRFNAIHAVTNIYPINHPKVFYIPNFVDSETFKPCLPKAEKFSVAFASRKVWQKGWDVFNEVTRNLDFDVLISGSVPEKYMPHFFSEAHVTVVPSRVDTFGLTIVESMMCKTPVITTPLPTHKALELPAFYATHPKEFMEKIYTIESLWESRREYEELSNLCRISSLRFDKKRIMDRLENMFKEVAQNL